MSNVNSGLILWGRSTSSNVQKVMWLCTEIGVDYERIDIGAHFVSPIGTNKEAAYLAINPNGGVPSLQDGHLTMWESNAICRYIAAKYRAESIFPGDLKHRAIVDQWTDWASTVFAPAITPVFWGLIRTPAEQRDANAIRAHAEKTAAALTILNNQLKERDFICGDNLTIADLVMGSNIWRWYNLPIESVGYSRSPLPSLDAYFARLKTRPAYQQVVMIDLV